MQKIQDVLLFVAGPSADSGFFRLYIVISGLTTLTCLFQACAMAVAPEKEECSQCIFSSVVLAVLAGLHFLGLLVITCAQWDKVFSVKSQSNGDVIPPQCLIALVGFFLVLSVLEVATCPFFVLDDYCGSVLSLDHTNNTDNTAAHFGIQEHLSNLGASIQVPKQHTAIDNDERLVFFTTLFALITLALMTGNKYWSGAHARKFQRIWFVVRVIYSLLLMCALSLPFFFSNDLCASQTIGEVVLLIVLALALVVTHLYFLRLFFCPSPPEVWFWWLNLFFSVLIPVCLFLIVCVHGDCMFKNYNSESHNSLWLFLVAELSVAIIEAAYLLWIPYLDNFVQDYYQI